MREQGYAQAVSVGVHLEDEEWTTVVRQAILTLEDAYVGNHACASSQDRSVEENTQSWTNLRFFHSRHNHLRGPLYHPEPACRYPQSPKPVGSATANRRVDAEHRMKAAFA